MWLRVLLKKIMQLFDVNKVKDNAENVEMLQSNTRSNNSLCCLKLLLKEPDFKEIYKILKGMR